MAGQVSPFMPPPVGGMPTLQGAAMGPTRLFEASPDEPAAPEPAPAPAKP
jgi:hypothetical protein